jgi:hypothetical protein
VLKTRECEAGEAHCKSVGNEREEESCRVKRKNLWGPSGKNKGWRCEPLSFAYFSLRRQRKVGAAPHRGVSQFVRQSAQSLAQQGAAPIITGRFEPPENDPRL